MKLPRPDLRALPDLFIRHGEKLAVVVVGLVALWLLWGSVHALQSLAVKDTQTPKAVDDAATQARGHIDREAQPPADLRPPREPLARGIDPWRMPLVPWWAGSSAPRLSIAKPPVLAALDQPLFKEFAKRSRPDVLPVEDLRAVAGLAILPAAVAAGGPGAAVLQPPVAEPPKPTKPAAGQGGRPRPGGDLLGVGPDRMPVAGMQPAGGAAAEPGRIVPYVVVTGLIPVRKQQEEYRSRFESAARPSDHNPKRDTPLWCDYEIERAAIGPDGKETWTRIDLAAVAKKRATDWGADAVVDVDPEFLLTSEDARSKQTTPIAFCSALPRRLDGSWDLADLHPWVVDRLAAKLAKEREAPDRAIGEPAGAGPAREGPGFDEMDQRLPEQLQPVEQRPERPEYRLFRFVDTAVVPGQTYRYRARLKVWNPNYDRNPEKMRPHLEDPALAVEPKLTSPESGPSTAATVPDTTRILVGTLRRGEIKEMRLKAGTLEVLVLAPSEKSGSFALRGLVADPGAIVDVDEEINKRYRGRARGEKVVTRRLLLDARGRQEDRRDGPAEKEKPPGVIPDPLDVICLRPDGSFEFASVADSERSIAAYRATLPPRGTKAEAKEPVPGDLTRPDFAPDQPVRPKVPF